VNRAQKEAYKRDYAAAKADGKPFFPYAVYKDLIVATAAIGIIIALAIWAKVEVGPVIDPTTEDYVPRPEWYFFFLFELLRIFKNQGPLTPVIMATFVIPNVLLVLLILWPFLDRSPERRIQKRPVSIMVGVATIAFLGWMTYKGATTPEGGGETPVVTIPAADAAAVAGEQLFRESGCLSCHAVGGAGASGPGPNLTDEGGKARGIEWHIAHLKDPQSKTPGSSMPAFPNFTEEEFNNLATFLDGLGTKYK
jgi:ubiquinol-cytochrome c reductase cytochrome b subunit/menaquinol-cytochrome c reductase cytochrome b/c subunit